MASRCGGRAPAFLPAALLFRSRDRPAEHAVPALPRHKGVRVGDQDDNDDDSDDHAATKLFMTATITVTTKEMMTTMATTMIMMFVARFAMKQLMA